MFLINFDEPCKVLYFIVARIILISVLCNTCMYNCEFVMFDLSRFLVKKLSLVRVLFDEMRRKNSHGCD